MEAEAEPTTARTARVTTEKCILRLGKRADVEETRRMSYILGTPEVYIEYIFE